MPEDRSLDDFAAADTAEPDASESDADDDKSESAGGEASLDDAQTDSVDPDGVEPAVATSTWHADGAACDRCGTRTERRWRDGDAFVCADCASW
jgi:hypothetical protein